MRKGKCRMESGKNIKVLFLTNIPSPYRVNFFGELGKYCDLTVLYEKKDADNREWEYNKKTNFTSVFMKGIRTGADHALCFEVIKYLKEKCDVIVIGGYSTPTGMLAIEYLRMRKIPFYLNCDGGFIKEEKRLNFIIKKHFIQSAAYWLSSGKETNKYLKHYGAMEEKIFNYPFTSVWKSDVLEKCLTREEKTVIRKELGILEEKVIVSVGQFIHRKGFDVLIKASSMLEKNVGVFIIGGIPTDEYIELTQECGADNVHFIKFCDSNTLKKYYGAADCMAFPTREDIWGLVINEALANGLPIVSTDKCIAALEIVGDAGIIVPSDDAEKLCDALGKIIENADEQKQLSEKALMRAKEYTIENMARVHVDIFDEN